LFKLNGIDQRMAIHEVEKAELVLIGIREGKWELSYYKIRAFDRIKLEERLDQDH